MIEESKDEVSVANWIDGLLDRWIGGALRLELDLPLDAGDFVQGRSEKPKVAGTKSKSQKQPGGCS